MRIEEKDPPARVLVVDDVKVFPFGDDVSVTYARTLADGLAHIEQPGKWSQIWLDHDLGGEDTIRPLVWRLVEQALAGAAPTSHLVICSLNPVGVDYMRSALERYYWLAYCADPADVRRLCGGSDDGGTVWY